MTLFLTKKPRFQNTKFFLDTSPADPPLSFRPCNYCSSRDAKRKIVRWRLYWLVGCIGSTRN